jgi:hypothetical protein
MAGAVSERKVYSPQNIEGMSAGDFLRTAGGNELVTSVDGTSVHSMRRVPGAIETSQRWVVGNVVDMSGDMSRGGSDTDRPGDSKYDARNEMLTEAGQ